MAEKHLKKIAEFFKEASGEENGILRRDIKDFLKKTYDNLDCNCSSCLFKEFQHDLKVLRMYGSHIYCSINTYEKVIVTKDRNGIELDEPHEYKKLKMKKPKRYFHLSTPEEFKVIIDKLEGLANGFKTRADELSDKKEELVTKEKFRIKKKQLNKKLKQTENEN